MTDLKLHLPTGDNLFSDYKCGLQAGQQVALRKDLVITDHNGKPTGKVHRQGEVWLVLAGIRSDPVLWFRQPDGERCTWDDDPVSVAEWFTVC